MEKPVFDTDVGIFDMERTQHYTHVIALPAIIQKAQEIKIIEEEKIGWAFLKDCDNERFSAALSFAEAWACHMQARLLNGDKLQDIWIESAHSVMKTHLCTDMGHLAVRLLSRHWEYRDDLRVAYTIYWKKTGVDQEQAQYDLLVEHIG